jgi:hypothetical protein
MSDKIKWYFCFSFVCWNGEKYIVFNVVVSVAIVAAAVVVGKIFIPYTTVSSNTSICYIYDVTYHINLLLLYNLEHSLIK